MLVSIIVPVYNAEKYLDKCILSLINQSYTEIEIILVNDGSTDKSLYVCNKYKQLDNRIIVVNKTNGGASSARNAGIKAANGDYIMFADADDYVKDSYVSTMVINQNRHLNSFIICDLCGFIGDGTFIKLHNDNLESGVYSLDKYYIFSEYLVLNQPVNKIFLRDKILENNLFFREDLPIAEDIYFNLEYLKKCENVVFVDKELYFCLTDRDNSLCHRYYDNLIEIERIVFSKHKELFDLFNVDKGYERKLYGRFYGSHLDCLDREIANSRSKKEMYSKMRTILKSDSFEYCLKKCKSDIDKKYYYMLRLKSPRIYYLYSKLSKMR